MKEIKIKQVNLWFVFIASILLGASFVAFGNDRGANDQSDQVFDQDFVHEMKIYIDPEVWESVRSQELSRQLQPADVIFDDQSLDDIGVANAFTRKSDPNFYIYPNLRLRFDHIRSGQRLLGLQGVDLKSFCCDDNSLIVERLAWELFFQFSVPASRTAYVKVFVNDVLLGPYQIIESTPDVISRTPSFRDNRGNLYKLKNTSRWPSRDSDDHDAFQLAPQNPNDPRSYIMERRSEHKPFEKPFGRNPDGKDLVDLILAFNRVTPEAVRVDVEKRLDLNSLIDYLAVDMALADTDGLIAYGFDETGRVYFQNNTYFYRPLTSEKFFVMPDDLDGAFDYRSASPNRDLMDGWDLMRITKLLLDNADLWDRYLNRVETFVNQFYDPDQIIRRINEMADQIRPAVTEDLSRTTDPPRPWTPAQWEARVDGLRRYVRDRADNLQQQLYGR